MKAQHNHKEEKKNSFRKNLPASIELGIVCWSSNTNLNVLLPSGRNPNFSAVRTVAIPMGGDRRSRVATIATVVRTPSFEAPGPVSTEKPMQ